MVSMSEGKDGGRDDLFCSRATIRWIIKNTRSEANFFGQWTLFISKKIKRFRLTYDEGVSNKSIIKLSLTFRPTYQSMNVTITKSYRHGRNGHDKDDDSKFL